MKKRMAQINQMDCQYSKLAAHSNRMNDGHEN